MTQQVLRNTGALLTQTFYSDESPVSAAGAVTVTVTTADGTVETTGPATLVAVGEYTYSLAPHANLGRLTLTWSGTFSGVVQTLASTVDVVGGFYVALAEIRALPGMADTAKYPTADLIKARQWFEIRFEDHVGRAFVPRGVTERVSGNGRTGLMLTHWPVRTVTAVRVYTTASVYTAYTVSELADVRPDPTGEITRVALGYWDYGSQNVQVTYEHGTDAPPADVKDAALVAIARKLIDDAAGVAQGPTVASERIGSYSVAFESHDPEHPFGISSVDIVANSYRARYRVPAIA